MARPKKLAGTVIRETVQLDEDLAGRLQDAIDLAERPKAEVLREAIRRGMDAYIDELCEARPEQLKQRIRECRLNAEAWKLYQAKKDVASPSLPIETPPDTVALVWRAIKAYRELMDLNIPYEPEALTAEDVWEDAKRRCNDERLRRHWQALEDLRVKGYIHLHLPVNRIPRITKNDLELCLECDEAIFNEKLDWTNPARKAIASLRRSRHLLPRGERIFQWREA